MQTLLPGLSECALPGFRPRQREDSEVPTLAPPLLIQDSLEIAHTKTVCQVEDDQSHQMDVPRAIFIASSYG